MIVTSFGRPIAWKSLFYWTAKQEDLAAIAGLRSYISLQFLTLRQEMSASVRPSVRGASVSIRARFLVISCINVITRILSCSVTFLLCLRQRIFFPIDLDGKLLEYHSSGQPAERNSFHPYLGFCSKCWPTKRTDLFRQVQWELLHHIDCSLASGELNPKQSGPCIYMEVSCMSWDQSMNIGSWEGNHFYLFYGRCFISVDQTFMD